MVLTTVNELRARCENVDIFLLSGPDCRRDTAELNQFTFEILPWDFRMKLRGFSILRLVLKNKHFDDELESNMWRIIRKADLVIDVSGFRLSSQFSPVRIVDYLINLHFLSVTRHLSSYSRSPSEPFNFSRPLSFFLAPLIRHYLRYPKKIFAREDDGSVALNVLGISHQVERSLDTVLQAGDHSFSRAFHNRAASELPDIPDGAVALVPNQKTMVHSGSIDMLDLYSQLIRSNIEMGRSVFLLRHSFEDVSIIDALKQRFADEDKVIALLGDYDAVDLQLLLSQFDFVIASRYHAVVHSYKARVPCLVLGWALKYPALMREFEQDELYFDIRQPLDTSRVERKLFELNRSRSDYSERIANKLESTMEKDIFEQAVRFVS